MRERDVLSLARIHAVALVDDAAMSLSIVPPRIGRTKRMLCQMVQATTDPKTQLSFAQIESSQSPSTSDPKTGKLAHASGRTVDLPGA